MEVLVCPLEKVPGTVTRTQRYHQRKRCSTTFKPQTMITVILTVEAAAGIAVSSLLSTAALLQPAAGSSQAVAWQQQTQPSATG